MLPLLLAAVAAVAAVPVQNSVVYSNAVDFSQFTAASTFSCLKSSGYGVVFIRAYNPVGVGAFDNNSVSNIRSAYNANVGTEVYMTPQPKSNKTAAQQFDETYNGLSANGVTLRSIWIQVVSPVNWGTNLSGNRNFISSLIVKAQNKGVSVGIYTSANDWGAITGNWTGAAVQSLWYYKVNGSGVSGESPANFNDFRPFGSFSSAAVKQYAQQEYICGIYLNRDVYASSSKALEIQMPQKPIDNKKIVAGGIISIH